MNKERPKSQNPYFKSIWDKLFEGDDDYGFVNLTSELDSCFHSILSPTLYGEDKFTRVFLFYWNCYFAIVNPLLKKYIELRKTKIRKRTRIARWVDKNKKINFEAILNSIHAFTVFLYDDVVPFLEKNCTSVYREIGKAFAAQTKWTPCGVLTTNYLLFSRRIAPKERSSVPLASLSGEMRLFETPNMDVFDAKESDAPQNEYFFPFLFGQSLVKPLINESQFTQLHRALNIAKRADALVVYGHSLSRDDSWIASLIRELLKKGKPLIIVCNESAKLSMESNDNYIRLVSTSQHDSVEFCVINYDDTIEYNIGKLFQELPA